MINEQGIIEVAIERSKPFFSRATFQLSSSNTDVLTLDMHEGMNLFDSTLLMNGEQLCKLSQNREVYSGEKRIGKIKSPVNVLASEKYFLETENGEHYSLVLEKAKSLSLWIEYKLRKADVDVARIRYKYQLPFIKKGGSVNCQVFDKSELGIALAFMIFVWADACSVDNSTE